MNNLFVNGWMYPPLSAIKYSTKLIKLSPVRQPQRNVPLFSVPVFAIVVIKFNPLKFCLPSHFMNKGKQISAEIELRYF